MRLERGWRLRIEDILASIVKIQTYPPLLGPLNASLKEES